MKFLLQYLKSHGRVCLGFLICAGLYGLIAWAYGIPMEAVGYTAFLCLGVLVILGSVDLLRSWNRYKILEQLKEKRDSDCGYAAGSQIRSGREISGSF